MLSSQLRPGPCLAAERSTCSRRHSHRADTPADKPTTRSLRRRCRLRTFCARSNDFKASAMRASLAWLHEAAEQNDAVIYLRDSGASASIGICIHCPFGAASRARSLLGGLHHHYVRISIFGKHKGALLKAACNWRRGLIPPRWCGNSTMLPSGRCCPKSGAFSPGASLVRTRVRACRLMSQPLQGGNPEDIAGAEKSLSSSGRHVLESHRDVAEGWRPGLGQQITHNGICHNNRRPASVAF
jgi:hypothetical protein